LDIVKKAIVLLACTAMASIVATEAPQLSPSSGAMIAPKWPTKRPTTYDVCGRKLTLPI